MDISINELFSNIELILTIVLTICFCISIYFGLKMNIININKLSKKK